MAAKMISGTVEQVKDQLVITDLVGTETVTVAVPANTIAIIIDGGVPLQSGVIDAVVERLQNALRELEGKSN